MSHEILDSKDAMFSAREGAGWTGLGREIPAGIAKDVDKLAEFIGATFRVVARPVFYRDLLPRGDGKVGNVHQAPGLAAQIRDDNGQFLGVTSDNRYHTDNRQPRDIIAAFRDELESERLEISHAVVLGGGKKIAVCATLPQDFDIVVGRSDRIRTYITLSTGYAARSGDSTQRSVGGIRVVCANTLAYSISEALADGRLRLIRASQRIESSQTLRDLVVGLGGELGVIANQRRAYNELANRAMSNDDVTKYFADVLEINIADLDKVRPDGSKLVSQRARNLLSKLAESYANAPGAAPGSAWGALNAVTYYTDHLKGVRDMSGNGDLNAARVSSIMDGSAAQMKERALSLLADRMSAVAIAA